MEGISELVRNGSLFDSFTIETIGKQVLHEEIEKIKNKENKGDESYQSDFEEYNEESKDSQRSRGRHAEAAGFTKKKQEDEMPLTPNLNSAPGSGDIESLLNPRLLGMMSAAAIQHYITALVESGHLSRAQTISPMSFFDRDSTPPTQIIHPNTQTPLINQNQSEFTVINPQPVQQKLDIPDDLRGFFDSPIGEQLLKIIKENNSQNPQQILEE